MSVRTFQLRGDPNKPNAYVGGPGSAPNPYIVSHGKNSQTAKNDPKYNGMFSNDAGAPAQYQPTDSRRTGALRPNTTASGVRPGFQGQGATVAPNNFFTSQTPAVPSAAQRPGTTPVGNRPGQPAPAPPLFGSKPRRANESNIPLPVVSDQDFEYGEGEDPYKETVVEQNMFQILHDHRDCMKPGCLEVKPPVIKKSVYNKDFVQFPRDEPIYGDANNPTPYKAHLPIDTDTTNKVGLFSCRPTSRLSR